MNTDLTVRSVLVLTLCIVCTVVQGGEYYVAPSGLWANAGTAISPWNLDRANSEVRPGDTILMLDGNYNVNNNNQINPSRSGNSANWIEYRAVNSRMAIIRDINGEAIVLTGRSYIIIDGIKVTNVRRYVAGEYSHHITINDCEFTGLMVSPSYTVIKFFPDCDRIHVTNSYLSDGSDILRIEGGGYHLVENNTINDNAFVGHHTNLALRGVQRSVIRNNQLITYRHRQMEIESSPEPPIRLSKYNLVENNFFDGKGTSDSPGIQFAGCMQIIRKNVFKDCAGGIGPTNYHSQGDPTEGWYNISNRVYNNVIVNCGNTDAGIVFTTNMPNSGDFAALNNIILNNTYSFAGASSTVQIGFEWDALPEWGYFYNNNIMGSAQNQDVFFWNDSESAKNRHPNNLTLSEWESYYPDTVSGNIQVDPLFVNPGGNDYRLQALSNCIDAGIPLTSAVEADSGTIVHVKDSTFFCDGFGLVSPDNIRVGNETVTIVSIDYERDRITIDRSISWSADTPVSLDYAGSAPDIGAYEFGM